MPNSSSALLHSLPLLSESRQDAALLRILRVSWWGEGLPVGSPSFFKLVAKGCLLVVGLVKATHFPAKHWALWDGFSLLVVIQNEFSYWNYASINDERTHNIFFAVLLYTIRMRVNKKLIFIK